jgi:nucleoside-diphosphate-sugar epimerase
MMTEIIPLDVTKERQAMTPPVLVTGGTGTLGRLVVPRLHNARYDVRVLSRRGRPDEDGIRYLPGDLATGEGIEPAVDGVQTIVHCAGTAKGDEVKARHLIEAAARAGVRHLVFILVRLSSIDGRICVWEESRCTGLRAADPIAATPPPWRECLQRNAQLAAVSRSG